MEQINYRGIYQVYVKEAPKTKNLYEIRDFFINKVRQHPFATYIGMFDHYEHTRNIDGEIADNIIGAINIMFCFGKKLPDPRMLSVRPRSIGVCETDMDFTISFMEAPNPDLTKVMIQWVDELFN